MIIQYSEQDFIRARILGLQRAIIAHPLFETALAQIEEDIAAAAAGLDAQARLVCGQSGSGKTTLVKEVVKRHPVRSTADGDVRPVVHVELAEATTKKAMVSAIFQAMGYDNRARLTANQIVEEISDKVERLGVKMILVDEAHHLINGREIGPITEFLKSLLNRIGCNIVLVGLPELQNTMHFEQFDRRLRPDIALAPYNWSVWQEKLQFVRILAKFEQLCGLEKASKLASNDLAPRIYVATGGHIGIVVKYLIAALTMAIRSNTGMINKKILAEVYAEWHPTASPPKEINFSAKAVIDETITLDDAMSAVGRPVIDKDNNPFACKFSELNDIWEARQLAVAIETKSRAGRPRARGTGNQAPKAFH